jgi:hypothetical protein
MNMGLDLTLVPIRHHEIGWWLATERLSLDRDGLGHMIGGCGDGEPGVKTKPLPKKVDFDWYGDEGLKRTKTDAYGGKLEYVTAGTLGEAMVSYTKKNKFSPWNEAVIAFICALPVDTPVVLYWH